MNDILEKQGTEKRRTMNFLYYSLRKREDKTDEEIQTNMKKSVYDPRKDPLMPRLFRKFDPAKSTILQEKRRRTSMHPFDSKERFENSKMYPSKMGYGSQRTYLCINPYRQCKNKDLARELRSIGNEEAEKALINLEDKYQVGSGRNISSY